MSVALVTVPCCRCMAPCVSTPERWTSALCQSCRPAPAIAPHSVPWRPTVARMLPGGLGAILPAPRDRRDIEQAAKLAAERARYRILTPARTAAADEIGAGPRAALNLLTQDGALTWVTYAVAEDTERGELVRSIAVRVLRAGYGVWQDDRWSSGLSAYPSPHLCGSLEEWLLHVCGLPWSPPGPCERCGRPAVRRKADGELYKHTRADWRIPLRTECT